MSSLYTDGSSDRTVFGNRNPHTVGYGHRFRIHCGFHDLPCRPAVRRVVGKQCKPYGFPFFHKIASAPFVYDGADIAIGIQSYLVNTVLDTVPGNAYG